MTFADEQVEPGQAIYSKFVLKLYDLYALGFSGRLLWRCPVKPVMKLFNRHVTGNHLDVGVGTGFFLDRCNWPIARPRIALMDLNPNCLEAASRRIARYRPEIYRANVLQPIPNHIPKFDSISITWLLHCLPGSIHTKAAVFENLKPMLNPGGVIFGSTLLNDGVLQNSISRRLMAVYNAKGIFTNANDSLDGLEQVLRENFRHTTIETIGCGALFAGAM